MADQQLPDTPDAPPLSDIAQAVVDKAVSPPVGEKLEQIITNAGIRAEKAVIGAIWDTAGPLVRTILKLLLGTIQASDPVFDDIAKIGVDAVMGDRPRRGAVPDNVGKLVLEKLSPAGGAVEPGTEAAVRYLTSSINQAIEGWMLGLVSELVVDAADIVRGSGATLQSMSHLREVVDKITGGDRITRRVLAPFIDAGIVTPARWAMNKQYRPELLSASDAIRQYLRGNWTRELAFEELARLGYSDGRIDALIDAQQKYFSPSDVRTFVERQHWTSDRGLQHLRDQGYDEATALDALRLEGLHIFESHEAAEATTIINAYASHDIDRGDFVALLQTYVEVDTRRALYEELGELRRRLFIRHLSSSQAEQLVKARILNVTDYRAALIREGYDDQAVTGLELLLRFEMDKEKTIAQHRLELEQQRAAEKALRDAAAAARKAEVDRDRALKRRGPLSDLERATVRGLIPFARVEEVLGAEYDPDTVEILVGLMEQDRQTYLAQQAAAEDARKRAARRDIDVGTLEQAVYDNLLTVDAFRQRLALLKFDPADAALLAAVVAARKADLDAAKRKRDDAEKAAKNKSIDLGRFERLVRLGARSLADYDALLASLGFDDPSRAAMRELLQLDIAKDQQAAAERQAAEDRLRAKGLSLEQFRRAVVLGLKTVDDYNRFLVNQGFTADAIATLVAEVVLAVADAEAARRKRAAAGATGRDPELSLAVVARAARLGILTPADYQARLVDAGYSPDDIAIELQLLDVEIADVQAARARRDLLQAETGERGLSLRELEQAVKAGIASIDEYRARAFSLNYSADDVELLVALLEDELAAKAATAPPEQ